MPRKVSHGWSFRKNRSFQSSGLGLAKYRRKKTLPETNQKRIFLQPKIIEALVENFSHWEDLANGKVPPENQAGRNFVEMANGKRAASTEYELGYKYIKRYNISLAQLKEKLEEIKEANNSKTSTVYKSLTKRNTPLSQQAMRGTLKSKNSKAKISKPSPRIDHSQIPDAGLATKPKEYAKKVFEPLGTRDDYKKDRASWKKGGL